MEARTAQDHLPVGGTARRHCPPGQGCLATGAPCAVHTALDSAALLHCCRPGYARERNRASTLVLPQLRFQESRLYNDIRASQAGHRPGGHSGGAVPGWERWSCTHAVCACAALSSTLGLDLRWSPALVPAASEGHEQGRWELCLVCK